MYNKKEPVQKHADFPEGKNTAKGVFAPAVPVLQQNSEEEELLQPKPAVQKMVVPEDPVQGRFIPAQSKSEIKPKASQTQPFQLQPNNTGMPDTLKSGLESMSGYDLSDVKVHYNSAQPAQLNALAYAQGNDIHVGPGQEKHLPHEGWHVVQQRQGRVKPTIQMKQGIPVNDNPGLEKEADVMGAQAMQRVNDPSKQGAEYLQSWTRSYHSGLPGILQAVWRDRGDHIWYFEDTDNEMHGIRWYYHALTDKMVFNVDAGNEHAQQLEELKGDSYNWDDWMRIWRQKGWLGGGDAEIPQTEEVKEEKNDSDTDDDEVADNTVYITSNPGICQGLVRLWIKYGGDLRLFYNSKKGEIWAVKNSSTSVLHQDAKELNADSNSRSELEFVNHLRELYGDEKLDKLDVQTGYDDIMDGEFPELGKLQPGQMMHVSLRPDELSHAGHAVGLAFMGGKYYIFDPNKGNLVYNSIDDAQAAIAKFLNYKGDDSESKGTDDERKRDGSESGDDSPGDIQIIEGGGYESEGETEWSHYTQYWVYITTPDIKSHLP